MFEDQTEAASLHNTEPPAKRPMMRERLLDMIDQNGFSRAAILSESKTRHIVLQRHYLMWQIRREFPSMSLARIGSVFGGRDHTTVLHGINAHQKRIDSGDPTPWLTWCDRYHDRRAVSRHSEVSGIFWHKMAQKWSCQVYYKGKRHYLGLFEDFEKAVEAKIEFYAGR